MIMSRSALLLVALLTLAGCKARIVPVDVHHYHRDSVATIQRDTILQVDSVIIKQVGDTIYIRETSDRVRATSESKSNHRVDSVPPPSVTTLKRIIEDSPPQKGGNILLLLGLGAAIPIALYVTYRLAKNKR
nr:MAG TPA: Prokaryotic membrane lipoprotein lipid attachment site [Caudoviricetes sp.]